MIAAEGEGPEVNAEGGHALSTSSRALGLYNSKSEEVFL